MLLFVFITGVITSLAALHFVKKMPLMPALKEAN